MTDLTEFLLARIAEAEEGVRSLRAFDDQLFVCDYCGATDHPEGTLADGATRVGHDHGTWVNIYDRDRVMAECDTRRQIITEFLRYQSQDPEYRPLEQVVRWLAEPFASHDGYRDEWAS